MSVLLAAAQTLAARFGYHGSAAVYRPDALSSGMRDRTPALHTAALTVAVLPITRAQDLQLLRDQGDERSRYQGWVAAAADVLRGDELHISSDVYTVETVLSTPVMVILGLSKQGA